MLLTGVDKSHPPLNSVDGKTFGGPLPASLRQESTRKLTGRGYASRAMTTPMRSTTPVTRALPSRNARRESLAPAV